MVPAELEKPRVTEIQVPMDCNGCVQKIKKALHGINGIYDIYFDLPQQKITIIGWADPEKLVKSIKKTRKIATICSHIEATLEQPPEGGGAPPAEIQQTEPPPPPDAHTEGDPPQHSRPKDVEKVHIVYHHPPDYAHIYGYGPNLQYIQTYSGQMNNYPTPNVPGDRPEPPQYTQYSRPEPPQYTQYSRPEPPQYGHYSRPEPPQYAHYSRPEPPQYAHYSRPEPPQYAHYSRPEPPKYTEYSRPEPAQHMHYSITQPRAQYTQYSRQEPSEYNHHARMEQYSEDYRHGSNNGNGNITSVFSDENPNACQIV